MQSQHSMSQGLQKKTFLLSQPIKLTRKCPPLTATKPLCKKRLPICSLKMLL